MTKQLLIYQSAVPVSASRHAQVAVEPTDSYAFSAGVNAVPLMAVEFPMAATEYAIVFAGEGDAVMPAVILGARAKENLYLGKENAWQAKYVPAFLRRYPFIFSGGGDGIFIATQYNTVNHYVIIADPSITKIEDLRGKRQAMDGVFHMHHLAHAHNQLITGNLVGGLDAKAMAAAGSKGRGAGAAKAAKAQE